MPELHTTDCTCCLTSPQKSLIWQTWEISETLSRQVLETQMIGLATYTHLNCHDYRLMPSVYCGAPCGTTHKNEKLTRVKASGGDVKDGAEL
jgi:hypothetical protein